MSALTEIPEDIQAAVSSVSRQLRSRYRDFCEYEDIQQELYVWYVKNHRKVDRWEEEYDHPKSVQRLLSKSLRNAGEKFCRQEKAARSGYEPEDEFFYSVPMVADMLALYFDPDWDGSRALDFDQAGGGSKPPQEGWNLQAMVADVGKAYEALPAADQDLLAFVYNGDRPSRDAIAYLALDWGITQGAADRRIRRVVGRIRTKLGGPRPFSEEEEVA